MGSDILIVDDEESIRFSLRGILEDEGHGVREAASGEEALDLLAACSPDLIFLDIWLTGMDGLEVLDEICTRPAAAPVIMISGHGNIETAVAAIKKGAFDFIEKPLSLEKVILAVDKGLELANLRRENQALRSRISERDEVREVTGESKVIRDLREQIGHVAPTDAWVLISGENGTGKEIVARSVHQQSMRADKPLVAVNCAAIPEELIESELFGHEKGAFTSAESSKQGKFEMAHKGTLFLDEIGDMSLKTQAKILRILQEQFFERVGGSKTIRVDVRVVAASNKDLAQEIQKGAFREDLYYRLKVFPLHVPPLRQRKKDIPLLIDQFVQGLAREHGVAPLLFTSEAMEVLQGYSWPGNVRELKNFVERMHIMHRGKTVDCSVLPPEIAPMADVQGKGGAVQAIPPGPVDFKQARAEFEAGFIAAKLEEYNGNVGKVAEAIGMERSSLYRKLKAYNIQATE
ncbi:MAG: sigma-54-dependent Fis family transcriptional regulator [Desulfovibrio sp.]|nr:MAG: sigma-54-dependent Fis family transcriptional regulator [Desulfovibrio sp.]